MRLQSNVSGSCGHAMHKTLGCIKTSKCTCGAEEEEGCQMPALVRKWLWPIVSATPHHNLQI